MTPDEIQQLRAPIILHAMETLGGRREPGVTYPAYPIALMGEYVERLADGVLTVASANLPPNLPQPILDDLGVNLSRVVADSAVLVVRFIFRARTDAGIDLQ